MNVYTFRGHVLREVPWKDLTVERASAFGLAWGQSIQAHTDRGEEFTAVYGQTCRTGVWNVALLSTTTRRAYAVAVDGRDAARELADRVVLGLLEGTCASVAAECGLPDVGTEQGRR